MSIFGHLQSLEQWNISRFQHMKRNSSKNDGRPPHPHAHICNISSPCDCQVFGKYLNDQLMSSKDTLADAHYLLGQIKNRGQRQGIIYVFGLMIWAEREARGSFKAYMSRVEGE